MSSRRANDNAFTLIEVIFAMGLFSIAMMGLVPMAVTALQHSNAVKNRTIAITLARDKIDALKRVALTAPLTSANNAIEYNIDTNGVQGNGIFTRQVTITGGAGQLTTLNVNLTWTDYQTHTLTQTTLLSQ